MKTTLFSLLPLVWMLYSLNAIVASSFGSPSLPRKNVNDEPVHLGGALSVNRVSVRREAVGPWYAPWHKLSNGNSLHMSIHRITRHEVHKKLPRKKMLVVGQERRRKLLNYWNQGIAPAPSDESIVYTLPNGTYIPMDSTIVVGTPFDIGEYFAYVSLGTPPQSFNLSIATARDYIWVPCKCRTFCGSVNKRLLNLTSIGNQEFNYSRSSSFRDVSCGSICDDSKAFSNNVESVGCGITKSSPGVCGYNVLNSLNGSAMGTLVTDYLKFKTPGNSKVRAKIKFGCASILTNTSYYPQGVLGLGRGGGGTLSQLFQSNIITNFWICFESDANSTIPGYIGFNYTQTSNFTSRSSVARFFEFANNSQATSPYYAIVPSDFIVNSTSIYPKVEVIVLDTGRSMSNLPQEVYDSFLAALEAESEYSFIEDDLEGLNCSAYENDQNWYDIIASFPPITFTFYYSNSNNNLPPYTWSIKPEQYLQPGVSDSGLFCVAATSKSGVSIFGSRWMQDKFIQFDLKNKNLWWMDMNCTSGEEIEVITPQPLGPSPPFLAPPFFEAFPPPGSLAPPSDQSSSSLTIVPCVFTAMLSFVFCMAMNLCF